MDQSVSGICLSCSSSSSVNNTESVCHFKGLTAVSR
uniref:Uncharacterized protein n=2 Tax=Nothobranchius kuhntae TaxID=321403 RepID=A0A1A8HSX8_NOTKU